MSPPPGEADGRAAPGPSADHYHGFSLRSVTWGYREIFADVIDDLLAGGDLGDDRREVTETFFDLLKRSNQTCFDHVLRQFLAAVGGPARWVLGLPGIFHDLVELGAALAEDRLYYGTRLFETLAAGGMGRSPAELRLCIEWVRRLREIDNALAMAMLTGFDGLVRRLRPAEFERYVGAALEIHRNDPGAAAAFLRGDLSTSETYLQAITQEASLAGDGPALAALLGALTGQSMDVTDLGELDSDELIARGTHTLTVEGHLYLPARFRRFDRRSANRNWLRLCCIASAAMWTEDSFARVQGQAGFTTIAALAGDDGRRISLLQTIEYARVLRAAGHRWPGCRRLIRKLGLTHLRELAEAYPRGPAASPLALLIDTLDETVAGEAVEAFRGVIDHCVNCFHAAELIDDPRMQAVWDTYPSLSAGPLGAIGFLSDFLFPVEIASAEGARRVADLRKAATSEAAGGDEDPSDRSAQRPDGRAGSEPENENAQPPDALPAAYLYDEWDAGLNAYRPDWCRLREVPADPACSPAGADALKDQADRVRKVFERIRPDLARREKRLPDGDEINHDLLVEHRVARRREPAPPARFYEKPLVRRRDLCVMLLLDVSGSTGEQLDGRARVLDVEKRATVILGQALSALGDPFAVAGFSSNGRQQCEFIVLKSFSDAWADQAVAKIMGAWPRSSTRMGPALRHAGRLLDARPHRRRLILLVTDGKPQDTGYDPATRYAQHDVRMACEENRRRDILTFAISTEANSAADMEIMFPGRRFVILPSIEQLPRVLPRLYLTLTT